MRRSRSHGHILVLLFCLLLFPVAASAQFKTEAFKQNYNDTGAPEDSVEALFSLKQYFQGLAHKETLRIGNMAGGSALFVGGSQIYNKQYWKLPVIYTGLGATAGAGAWYRHQYNLSIKPTEEVPIPEGDALALKRSKWLFAGAGLIYWCTAMDGIYNYEDEGKHMAGKATLYSILCPGLGQIYNGEYWKVPVYWGCLLGGYYFYNTNNTNYLRFKRIYNEATANDGSYKENIPADTALYYRDVYRRMRDYSTVAIAAFYLLQVIDANVFAYMQDFEVTPDLSMGVRPTVIMPDMQLASSWNVPPGIGMSLGIRF